jgi:hypothetical protein
MLSRNYATHQTEGKVRQAQKVNTWKRRNYFLHLDRWLLILRWCDDTKVHKKLMTSPNYRKKMSNLI